VSDYVYKVIDVDGETYWMDDETKIVESFGKVIEVTRYYLMNPEDITDSVNGDYLE
jgi:hypothetical protein